MKIAEAATIMKSIHVILLLLLLVAATTTTHALPLYGCELSEDLCENGEVCIQDGLFGQCYDPEGTLPPPAVLAPLDDLQLQLLQLELTRLAEQKQDWADSKAQCVLAYYKLSIAYDLQYDPDFCQVNDPSNIWALVQLIELGVKEDAAVEEALEEAAEQPNLVPVIVETVDDDEIKQDALRQELESADEKTEDTLKAAADSNINSSQVAELVSELSEPVPVFDEDDLAAVDLADVTEEDAEVVSDYLEKIVRNGHPDLSLLSDTQLNALILSILEMKRNMEEKVVDDAVIDAVEAGKRQQANGEVPEEVAVDDSHKPTMLKKDAEKLGDVRTGLDPAVHNIVKGRRSDISKVVGNRIYLKVNISDEAQLVPLIEFLQNTIALPNKLIFDDFLFDNNQLSLRISRVPDELLTEEEAEEEETARSVGPKDKRIDTVEDVAKAVYKRRRAIQDNIGAHVEETGIGVGDESVTVESEEREWFLAPLLFISVFTIASLSSVLVVHLYKRRRSHYAANIRQLADAVDGKSDQAYQELCRARMSQDPAGHSKTSSTSSWVEDEKGGVIDISTGHVLLNFLQSSLSDPTRIDSQWEAIRDYRDKTKSTSIAEKNPTGNRAVTPYDETLVNIVPPETASTSSASDEYLNASLIFDDDPRQAAFIVGQSPLGHQFATFWRAVWQQGVNLIVNLSTLEESRADAYWPEKGSECHGEFEIHLVSEHIWSDDYLVRSFYLKNLKDGQTRTITQFHYVSWKANEAPATPKGLLEFRRKVNKSYRGRCSPLLIHSTEGAGRAGVYCAVDVICQRIQRGVKEIDIAASLEHLRDQRPCMVKTADQYKFIYACVAQEVSALLKGLQQ